MTMVLWKRLGIVEARVEMQDFTNPAFQVELNWYLNELTEEAVTKLIVSIQL